MSEIGEPPAHSPGAGDSEDKDLSNEANWLDPALQEALSAIPSAGLSGPEAEERRRELCEAAVAYAKRGWRVIPLRWVDPDGVCACPQGAECKSPGKHPVHDDWPNVGTADPVVVASWWRPETPMATEWFPQANIGVVTGRESGIWVLDVDTYNGGEQTLGNYERRNGPLPATRVHTTGRGGIHYFFRHPGFNVRNSAKKLLGQGLDVKGEHGQVVVPPSMSAAGPYTLNPAHDIEIADAPDWLLDILRGHDSSQAGASLSGEMPAEATGAARRYAEAALKSESDKMRKAAEGERNNTLNECAFSLGNLGGAGLLSEDAAFAALREAALAAGLTDGEIRPTFSSGWRAGLDKPRNVQWNAMAADWPARAFSEFGMADRMADHFGDTLRWCPERGTWMRYENGVWVTDVKDAAEWAAQMMIRRLPLTEAISYDDTPDVDPDGTESESPRKRFLAWVAKQETRKSVSSAARLATGVPLMRMSESTFNADPMALNVSNGVVDLATGQLRKHSPEDRMTLQCAAPYLNTAAPMWEEFLQTVQPEPEMRGYLQRVAGYCATGLTAEQAFFLLHGAGANGKSVWQGVIQHVLGTYAQTLPVDTLMASSVDGRIPNDVARMAGKRFMAASETKAGKSLDEQKMKQLTGGDTIAARFMRAEYFEFRPVGKIFLTTNHLPKMSDDSATWRRIHLIRWPVVIPDEEQDGRLQEKLVAQESAGILRWIIEGALAWREEGLNAPESVHQAREEYQQDEDVVGQFALECLEEVEEHAGAVGRDVKTIYFAYKSWAADAGGAVMGQRSLTTRLMKKFPYVRRNGWAGFPGVQVRQHFGPPEGDE